MIYKIVNNLVEIETGNLLIRNNLLIQIGSSNHLQELICLNIPFTPLQLNCGTNYQLL